MATLTGAIVIGLAIVAQAPATAPYRASGGEPTWSLEIGDGQLRMRSVLGPDISIPTPRQERIRDGYRYRAPNMVVVIRHRPCEEEDARIYADTVHITAFGYTARGCGGAWVGGEPLDPNDTTQAAAR